MGVKEVDVPDVVLTLTSQEITSSQGEAFVPVNVDGISFPASVGSLIVNDVTFQRIQKKSDEKEIVAEAEA